MKLVRFEVRERSLSRHSRLEELLAPESVLGVHISLVVSAYHRVLEHVRRVAEARIAPHLRVVMAMRGNQAMHPEQLASLIDEVLGTTSPNAPLHLVVLARQPYESLVGRSAEGTDFLTGALEHAAALGAVVSWYYAVPEEDDGPEIRVSHLAAAARARTWDRQDSSLALSNGTRQAFFAFPDLAGAELSALNAVAESWKARLGIVRETACRSILAILGRSLTHLAGHDPGGWALLVLTLGTDFSPATGGLAAMLDKLRPGSSGWGRDSFARVPCHWAKLRWGAAALAVLRANLGPDARVLLDAVVDPGSAFAFLRGDRSLLPDQDLSSSAISRALVGTEALLRETRNRLEHRDYAQPLWEQAMETVLLAAEHWSRNLPGTSADSSSLRDAHVPTAGAAKTILEMDSSLAGSLARSLTKGLPTLPKEPNGFETLLGALGSIGDSGALAAARGKKEAQPLLSLLFAPGTPVDRSAARIRSVSRLLHQTGLHSTV